MKSALKVLAACATLIAGAAQAQQPPPNYMGRVGGVTKEVCVTPVVTSGSAYSAGNVVGGLITFANAMLSANSGSLQSIRMTTKSVQSAEFDISFLSALPSAPSTEFPDKAAPAIAAADVGLVLPPIKLTTNFSGLGTHTVYGADAIARAVNNAGSSAYAVITTPGTPTFTSASDLQLCATWYQD
jgi:hypothetical protein